MPLPRIQLIVDGEPVIAGVPNRPLTQIANNAQYIWQVLEAANVGSTVFARQVTVEAGALVGMPVYWNAANSRFERAIAAVSGNLTTGQLETAASAQPWGVVFSKTNSTLADLLLLGYAPLALTAALESGLTLQAGTYYLSRLTPGALTSVRPPVPIPVLRSDGSGKVYVNTVWENLLTAHTHLHFDLKARPAGTNVPPAVGEPHEITVADDTIEGWLPASYFTNPPPDARFGYNLAANPSLQDAWPPTPPDSAVVLKNGVKVSADVDDGLILFTREGIWWLSDCYGSAPWPDDYDSSLPDGGLSEYSVESYTSLGSDCPDVGPVFELELYFSQFAFMSDTSAVTSLVTSDPRIKITCQGTNTVASLGPLDIALNLEFVKGLDTEAGVLAFKEFDATTQTWSRGPVATGLYALSTNVSLRGEASASRTIDGSARTLYHGAVGVDLVTSFNRDLPVQLVRLDGVLEQFVSDAMYLGFPAARVSSLRGRILIPELLDVTNPKLQLKLRILGRGTGNLPALTITYRRIVASGTPIALPTTDTALTFDTTGAITANYYVDMTMLLANAISVAAGDNFEFTISRSSDAYNYELGILRLAGIITAG